MTMSAGTLRPAEPCAHRSGMAGSSRSNGRTAVSARQAVRPGEDVVGGETIRFQILDAGGHFRRRAPAIRRAVAAAVAYVEAVSDLSNVDLIVHPTDFGRDQFAIAAFTMGPHNVHIGVERSQLSSDDLEAEVYRTTIHELHHALRWRSIGRWTVAEAVILEGLALLADRAAAGRQDSVDRPLWNTEQALAYVVRHYDHRLEDHRNWLYTSEAEQPGAVARAYTVGLLLMQGALATLRIDAWAAAARPAGELIDAGLRAQGLRAAGGGGVGRLGTTSPP